MDDEKTPIERAIEAAGSQEKLAAKIGRSQQIISYWKTKGVIRAEDALAIEAATGIPKHELRPDIFGAA